MCARGFFHVYHIVHIHLAEVVEVSVIGFGACRLLQVEPHLEPETCQYLRASADTHTHMQLSDELRDLPYARSPVMLPCVPVWWRGRLCLS